MKVIVTGATGFIGRPLCGVLLGQGHILTAFSRDGARAQKTLGGQIRSLSWLGADDREWRRALAEADAVIHLAGESVAGARWTPEFKAKIRDSRVVPTRALAEAMAQADRRPAVLVSASAVGYYGDRGDAEITEESPPANDFLGEVCQAWEAEARGAEALGVRVARMRVGIVLGEGGALQKMLYPLPLPISPWKLGLGGPIGSGRQWMPWIHLHDVVGLFLWAMANAEVSGAVNMTAPAPVTNAELTRALGRALRRPELFPVPAFALKAMFGEFADSLLGGQKVLPTVAERLGYPFQYRALDAALHDLLKK